MSLQPALPTKSQDHPGTHTNGEVEQAVAVSPPHSSAPKATALPRAQRKTRRMRVLIPIALLIVGCGAGAALYAFRGPQNQSAYELAPVGSMDLRLLIRERGTLEAKENHDVKCEVKAGSRGNAKIKWVVENGSIVNKGDPLVEIDDSTLQEQAQKQKIDRLKALQDRVTAEQAYPAKQIAVDLAKKQLEQWVKGDFPQQLHDLEGQIQNAESIALQQEDRTAWALRMVKKGYTTASQAEAEQANLTGKKLDLQQVQEKKKVLLEYTDPVKRQTLENAIKQAIFDEATAKANLETATASFELQDTLYKDLESQIRQCKVNAEHAGIVVYAVPEQAQRGMGGNQSIIAQGESVAAGQKMLSIPDLSHMLVKVRIHEAFINNMKPELKVKVRVDALGDKELNGKVKYVASVPAPADWMSPDVKVYECMVEITDYLAEYKLKPGLSAVCTILTDLHAEHVLAIPIQSQAVLGPLSKGGPSRCYVLTDAGPQPREIELGMSDGKYVEVKSGLNEGDKIILNARTLFAEKEKKASGDPKSGPPSGKPDGSGRQGKGKGKGKGGPPPGMDQ